MLANSIWCTLSPVSATSLGAGTVGVPISAPRPFPKPERAMRLRLPEQTRQRKQQSVVRGQTTPCLLCGKLRNRPGSREPQSPQNRAPCRSNWQQRLGNLRYGGNEKSLKKVLTLKCQIQYHGARFQKRQRIFAR